MSHRLAVCTNMRTTKPTNKKTSLLMRDSYYRIRKGVIELERTLSRDVQLLEYILRNQRKIQRVLVEFKCDFSMSEKGLCNNEYAFDLCSLYMIQTASKIIRLTDESRIALENAMRLGAFVTSNCVLSYKYDEANKDCLQKYIEQVISESAIGAVRDRYSYCFMNKYTVERT